MTIARACALSLAFLAALPGCGGGAPSNTPDSTASTSSGEVKGRVTLDGKPVARVEVRFNPANVNRKGAPTASATTKADGTYAVTTLVGDNTVTLGGPSTVKNAKLQYVARKLDVRAGSNSFDLTLP